MDRAIRLLVALLLIAWVLWRLNRYIRLGLSRHRGSLGAAGGIFPTSPEVSATVGDAVAPVTGNSTLAWMMGVLVAVAIWLAANAVLWFGLLELPILKAVPPIPLGVVGILANFYLIPFAQSVGRRCRTRIDNGIVQRK
jgi:hypothetical protein